MFSSPAIGVVLHNIALCGNKDDLISLTGVNAQAYRAVREYLSFTNKALCDYSVDANKGNQDDYSKLRHAVIAKAGALAAHDSPKNVFNEKFLNMYVQGASLQFKNSASREEARGEALCAIILGLRQEGKRCEYALPLIQRILNAGPISSGNLAKALHLNASKHLYLAISSVYERDIALAILRSGITIADVELTGHVIEAIEAGDQELVSAYLQAMPTLDPFFFARVMQAARDQGDQDILTMVNDHPSAVQAKDKVEDCVIS